VMRVVCSTRVCRAAVLLPPATSVLPWLWLPASLSPVVQRPEVTRPSKPAAGAAAGRLHKLSRQLNVAVLARMDRNAPHESSVSSMGSETHGEASGKAALALFRGSPVDPTARDSSELECVAACARGCMV
jgi:hypothetical protein